MEFTNKVAGNGIIFVGAGNVALLGDNTAFKGKINVESGAVATVSDQKTRALPGYPLTGNCSSIAPATGCLATRFLGLAS